MPSILFWVFSAMLFAVFEEAKAGEYCVTNTVVYCVWGCCGHYPDTHCCSIGTVAILGLVSGCVILLAAVLASIVLAVYLCKRKNLKRGRVIQGPTAWDSQPPCYTASNTSASGPVVYTSADGTLVTTPPSIFRIEDSYPGSLWYGPGIPIQLPAYQTTDPSPSEPSPPSSPPPAYSATPLAQQIPDTATATTHPPTTQFV